MKEWFKARNLWGAAILALSDAEAGRLAKALWAYTMGGEEQNLSGAEKGIFAMIQWQLSQDDTKEDDISQKRAAAGASGGKQKVANANFATEEEANVANDTNKNKNTETELEKETKKEKKEKKGADDFDFDVFWAAYPRKEAKVAARKVFDKLQPDEQLMQKIISAINRWKQSAQWQENGGQYIPHPATWLNQRRWEDEPPKPSVPAQKPVKPVVAQQYEQRDYSSNAQSMDDVLDMLRGGMR